MTFLSSKKVSKIRPLNPQSLSQSASQVAKEMSSSSSTPFPFPEAKSSVLPDPSRFFSPDLLSNPLPTNSFFQNFTINNGDQPEYFHPYIIKPSPSSLSISYPSLSHSSAFVEADFNADITITGSDERRETHVITSFSDLGVTLEYPSSNLTFFLVRGSPYITFSVKSSSIIKISTTHAIESLSSISMDQSSTKYTVKLENNNQTWLIYVPSTINLTKDGDSSINCGSGVSGIIRIAVLPDSSSDFESTLDKYSHCYPVSGHGEFPKPFALDNPTGHSTFAKPFVLEYKWDKEGYGDLLMLAHPLHLKLFSKYDRSITVLENFKYNSMDGNLVGVVGDSWALKPDGASAYWYIDEGVQEDSHQEIISALIEDVNALDSSNPAPNSSYSYGKLIARAARLALIAEEVRFPSVIPAIKNYLKMMIKPWLKGTFEKNGFFYDPKWGGLITKQGSKDSEADFGFGMYNDHHYQLGYFVYAIAVLAKIDSSWAERYKHQAYTLMSDYLTFGNEKEAITNSNFPPLRCFDMYKLHSWGSGLTECANGRKQKSTSEAVNAYYSAALLGEAYGDKHLWTAALTVMTLEIDAAKMWWQVKEDDVMYPQDFTAENRLVGVLWSIKRESSLSFAPKEWKECRLGIQLSPLLPVSRYLFSDIKFVEQLVSWTKPALAREGVGEGWKGFVYALESLYDKDEALEKIRGLNGFDDGNSLSNLLCWIHRRVLVHQQGYCVPPLSTDALDIALANASSPAEKRDILGEAVHSVVERIEYEKVDKVTGMLLEMEQTEVLYLLETPAALHAKVSEALDVLRDYDDGPSGMPFGQPFSPPQLANAENILGESLYEKVDRIEPENVAKVTGMLLELDQTEILHLLESPADLYARISEALDVLKYANQQTTEHDASDGN